MNLWVIAFIVVIVLVGYGLTLLLDVVLTAEERLFYGAVVGVMVVSIVGFVFAWWAGMSRGTMVAASLASLGLSGPGWWRRPERILDDWRDFRSRLATPIRTSGNPFPLIVITLISLVAAWRILGLAYGTTDDGGVSVGHLSTFGDWSAHLAYAASFAYADNFPPELPTAAGESFAYHFGIDWFSAMFVPLGLSLQGSLQVSSGILAVAFPGVMYVASLRFVTSRLAASIGVMVFLLAGGTAALYRFFFEDLLDGGIGVLWDLPRSYAFDGFDRNWLDNPISGFLYPQRPTMIGFAAVLLGLALLWQNRAQRDWRTYLFVGLVTGFLPVFHVFSFGVLIVIGLWWAALERHRGWLWFVTPALVIGVPTVWWQLPSNGAAGREFPHLGWVLGKTSWAQSIPDFVWFWLLNTGVFIPLVIVALLKRRELGVRFLPIFGLLLIANVGIWHFWIGNNAKYVVFFLLLGAPFVGDFLAGWIRRSTFLGVGALVLLFSLVISGGLDMWRAFEGSSGAYPAAYMSGDDVLVGEWARDLTETDAVFAVANNNVHPVRAIAGRTVVSGSAGRLSDLGIDWVEREEDLRTIYALSLIHISEPTRRH